LHKKNPGYTGFSKLITYTFWVGQVNSFLTGKALSNNNKVRYAIGWAIIATAKTRLQVVIGSNRFKAIIINSAVGES
jgi:hypothetical protein